jgi:hypothetical protein
MNPVAEVLFFPLKPNTDPSYLLSEAADILSRQDGFRAAYYGSLIKDENIHCLIFEWQDRAALDVWLKSYDTNKAKEAYDGMVNMEAGLEPFISESILYIPQG